MIDHIPLKIAGVTGRAVYGYIPTNTLRHSVDTLFPYFSKCKIADCASGYLHRWRAGHDLLIDVSKTFMDNGLGNAAHQAGHILFTDFPTKAGIPIPGLSQSGLGEILKNLGISSGWLNLSFFDAGIGFLCVAEGHADLMAALSGNLEMSLETFFDTYIEGVISISFGVLDRNPLLLAGGAENLLAGVVSTYKSLESLWTPKLFYIDPIDFFGGAIGSAVVGGLFTLLFSREPTLQGKLVQSLKNASKSAALGALFTIESFLGYGALLGMMAYQFGNIAAKKDCEEIAKIYSIDVKSFDCFLKTVCEGDPKFMEFWESCFTCKTFDTSVKTFNDSSSETFDTFTNTFNDSHAETFNTSTETLDDSPAEIFDTSLETF